MVDKTGGVKNIPFHMVDEKKREGWIILDNRELNSFGRPKQVYYPQLDQTNKFYKTMPTVKHEVARHDVEILKVEIF